MSTQNFVQTITQNIYILSSLYHISKSKGEDSVMMLASTRDIAN
jgi:hypothetical protein